MLLLERLDRVTGNAASLVGSGAERPDLVDPQQMLHDLLAAVEAPAESDPERRELMDALGLGRG